MSETTMTDTETREETENREGREMRELAEHVARDLEAEAEFDPELTPWCSKCEGCEEFAPNENLDGCANCDHDPSDHDKIGDDETMPNDIWDNVDWAVFTEDPETALTEAYDQWRENVDVLDVSGVVSFDYGGGLTLQALTAVLGTGGPHVEVTFNDSGRGHVTAYGWFGAHRAEVPVSFEGHPIADLFELYAGTIETGR